MKRYDLYVYELGSEIILGWNKFDAADDDSAIAVTLSLDLSGRIELWTEANLVRRWDMEQPRLGESAFSSAAAAARDRTAI